MADRASLWLYLMDSNVTGGEKDTRIIFVHLVFQGPDPKTTKLEEGGKRL